MEKNSNSNNNLSIPFSLANGRNQKNSFMNLRRRDLFTSKIANCGLLVSQLFSQDQGWLSNGLKWLSLKVNASRCPPSKDFLNNFLIC